MGDLDKLGKELMRRAAGPLFVDDGPSVRFDFGPEAGSARIDGTVAGIVAAEVESRVPKQIRGRGMPNAEMKVTKPSVLVLRPCTSVRRSRRIQA